MRYCPNCGRTETDQPGSPCDVCGAAGGGGAPLPAGRFCVYCGAEVPSLRTGYQRVVSWTQPRAAGGANKLVGRELLPEFACARCVDRIRDGLDPAQAALV